MLLTLHYLKARLRKEEGRGGRLLLLLLSIQSRQRLQRQTHQLQQQNLSWSMVLGYPLFRFPWPILMHLYYRRYQHRHPSRVEHSNQYVGNSNSEPFWLQAHLLQTLCKGVHVTYEASHKSGNKGGKILDIGFFFTGFFNWIFLHGILYSLLIFNEFLHWIFERPALRVWEAYRTKIVD